MNEGSNTSDVRPVAFFDFDGTLTTGDTMMPFLKYVVGQPTYYAKLAFVSPVLAAYFTRLVRNDIAKQIVLKKYLAGYHVDRLFELGQRFSDDVIPTMLRHEGMARLRWHQSQGHECVLVSASMDFYLNAWARRECIDHVICTSLEKTDGGYISGKINGENCHGREKQIRVQNWLSAKGSTESYAYGDTSGDTPMLALVRYGYIWKSQKRELKIQCSPDVMKHD